MNYWQNLNHLYVKLRTICARIVRDAANNILKLNALTLENNGYSPYFNDNGIFFHTDDGTKIEDIRKHIVYDGNFEITMSENF